jgi:dienelactone hydrolase
VAGRWTLLVLLVVTVGALAAGCGSAADTGTSTPAASVTTTTPVSTAATTEASTTSVSVSAAEQARIDTLTDKALYFVELLVAGRFAAAHQTFDDTMKSALPADKLEQTWTALERQVGRYIRPTAVRHETSAGHLAIIVQGEFTQAPIDIRVIYGDTGSVAGLFFQPTQMIWKSPSYTDPTGFSDRDLTVGSDPWTLPGTLTLPAGDGPFPAVVLVHGSGPNDRDETIGPNKPFRDLAEGLATAGIAVLRYEKRTLHYAEALASAVNITVQEETVTDALAAVEALRTVPEVWDEHIFVLGHSLGGMMIPRIGAADPKIAAFIVAAGAARPLEDLALEQTRYLLSLEAEPTAEEKAALADLEQQVARVKDPGLSTGTPAALLPLDIPATYWLDLRGYDPPVAARDLGRPLLVIQGGRDYQVTQDDFTLWQTTLNPVAGAEFILYPELNHLFMAGEGLSRPSEYLRPGHVAENVVRDIVHFLTEIVAR